MAVRRSPSARGTFEAAGYTATYPSGNIKVLGYAHPATGTDGHGLPDDFEYVVGTNRTRSVEAASCR